MHRLDPFFAAMAALLCGLVGCSDNAITPKSIEVQGYVDFTATIALDLRLDGEQIRDATFSFGPTKPNSWRGQFSTLPGGPLDTLPAIAFRPRSEGRVETTLIVQHRGDVYYVPVVGEGKPVSCPEPPECRMTTFDPATATCGTRPIIDGFPCSGSDSTCTGLYVCQSGQCLLAPDAVRFDECAKLDSSTPIEPVWEYHSPSEHQSDTFSCAVGDEGDLYCLNRYASTNAAAGTCDLVALTSAGEERWRQVRLAHAGSVANGVQVTGDYVLMTLKSKESTTVHVHDRASGKYLWSFEAASLSTIAESFLVAGTDRVVQIVQSLGGRFEIRLRHLRDGLVLATLSPSAPEVFPAVTDIKLRSLLADEQGNVFISWVGSLAEVDGTTSFMNWGELFSPSGERLEYGTAANRETFFDVDAASGDLLFSRDGHLIEKSSLHEINQLDWKQAEHEADSIVLSPSNGGYVTHFGSPETFECTGWSIRKFDAFAQQSLSCRMPSSVTASVPDMLLTADGGFALVLDASDSTTVRIYDAQLQPQSDSTLKYHGDSFSLPDSYAISNNQLIVSVCPAGTEACTLAAYSIPGFELAPHGWVMPRGNPGQTSRPR